MIIALTKGNYQMVCAVTAVSKPLPLLHAEYASSLPDAIVSVRMLYSLLSC